MSKIKFCNLTKNLRSIRRFEVSKIYLQKSKVINSCMSACPQERGGISPRVKNSKWPEQRKDYRRRVWRGSLIKETKQLNFTVPCSKRGCNTLEDFLNLSSRFNVLHCWYPAKRFLKISLSWEKIHGACGLVCSYIQHWYICSLAC